MLQLLYPPAGSDRHLHSGRSPTGSARTWLLDSAADSDRKLQCKPPLSIIQNLLFLLPPDGFRRQLQHKPPPTDSTKTCSCCIHLQVLAESCNLTCNLCPTCKFCPKSAAQTSTTVFARTFSGFIHLQVLTESCSAEFSPWSLLEPAGPASTSFVLSDNFCTDLDPYSLAEPVVVAST